MSEHDNKQIIRRLYEDGWGKGDLEVIERTFAQAHVLHWNDLKPADQHRTAEEVKQIVRAYRSAFPDLQVTVNHLVAEGDRVAVQVTFVGTHTGEYEGFKPTHKKSSFTDMQIVRLQGGQIVESNLASGGLSYFSSILDGSVFDRENP